jgi:drug/metabolite transporter (DMT)-like permease
VKRAISANAAGVLWMLAGSFILTMQGGIVKHLSDDGLPLTVILFMRTMMLVMFIVPWAMRSGGLPNLYTKRLGTHFLRALFGLGMLTGSFYAVTVLPLSDAVALSFTRPIWSMFTAYLMLGEVVGWVGGLATLAGFGGVLVIVQPQTGVHIGVVVALAGAASSCLGLIYVKRLTTTEPVERILFYFGCFNCLVLAPLAFIYWQTPTGIQFLWLVSVALSGAVGQFMSAQAVKYGDMTVVVPVDFARVPFAAVIGFIVFAEAPGIWTFVGTGIILCATLVILRTRNRAARLERLSKTAQAAKPETP